jgi:hypothetical protein
MSLLARCFAIGRLARAPKAQTAGRMLPPASVQRSQLGLSMVDVLNGVVTVRGGEVRCLVSLSGFPLHRAGPREAAAFLAGFARALNALPAGAAWIVRSRPGGLYGHITKQEQWGPGSTALARLRHAQLAHARSQELTGAVRETTNYVVFRHPKGDVRALLTDAAAAIGQLRAAGLRAELVTEKRLAEALAVSWHPAAQEHLWVSVGETTLNYSPSAGARVRFAE